jgi:hypothetical protein
MPEKIFRNIRVVQLIRMQRRPVLPLVNDGAFCGAGVVVFHGRSCLRRVVGGGGRLRLSEDLRSQVVNERCSRTFVRAAFL